MSGIREYITGYIRSVLNSMVRVGVVVAAKPGAMTARVKFSDGDNMVSYDLRVLVRKVHADKDYWLPDTGDHVLCLFLPFGLEQGFIIGSFYSAADAVPVISKDKRHVAFADGTWLEYDRSSHVLSGHIVGDVDDLTIAGNAVVNVGKNADVGVGNNLSAIVGNDVSVVAGNDITAQATNNATVQAGVSVIVIGGTSINLTAPTINLAGNIAAAAMGGGAATETKQANTQQTGNLTLTGTLTVTGAVQVNGNINATGNIIDGGSNTNHHSHP